MPSCRYRGQCEPGHPAGVYGDVGIFYSMDQPTAFKSYPSTGPLLTSNNSGDIVAVLGTTYLAF